MRLSEKFAMLALALPLAALADINSTATVSSGGGFAFDTGSASASGDIVFTGSSITFQGGAKGGVIPGLTGSAGYANISQTVLQGLAALASTSPIPASSLPVGTIVGLQTKGGNAAKFLVTAISASSLAFQYTTYGVSGGGGGGGAGAPAIKDVQNNSSLIPDGFTNSGIAPSTLFVLHGSNLADPNAQAVLQDSQKGLPTQLNGASLTVTAGGKTYPIPLYYAIASQIAGVLPAAVPVGSATITATYNNQTSAPFTFNVVSSAYGIDFYNGNTAVVQDSVSGAIITPTASAKPGQIVTLWGSGLGANSADSDSTYTSSPHTIGTSVQVYFGGVRATNVAYSGASVYPGVHIIVATIPSGVPTGCFVPIAIVTGGTTLSNTPTTSIMPNGGVCSEPATGLTGNQLSQLTSQTNYKAGSVIVAQSTSPGSGTTTVAVAGFQGYSGSSFSTGGSVSIGACSVSQTLVGSAIGTITGLNAGTLTVTPPGGGPITMQSIPQSPGTYFAQISSVPASGGTFAFQGTGASGANTVGSFTATVNFPNPLISWTNQSASASVTRASGQTYTWSGGAPGTYVTMSGSASSGAASGGYTCIAPVEAGSFTVPAYILSGLPSANGTSMLMNSTNYSTFTAAGLDYGFAIGSVSFEINSVYK